MDAIRLIARDDLVPAAGTSGILRWVAAEGKDFWAGEVLTDPAATSGWHHHGEHDTIVYVLEGRMRIESGARGRHVVEGESGDYIHIPPRTVHREVNPGSVVARAVVVRIGTGEFVVNVAGPG